MDEPPIKKTKHHPAKSTKNISVIKKNIPNAITCINVIGGTIASIFAVNPFETSGGVFHYEWAWIFIAISMVADFFDGFVARLLHVKSEMGKELDSLCDMVSFGVAPAILTFSMLTRTSGSGQSLWEWGAILIAVGAALRLAKFNLDTRQTTSFLGLPVPANALFWIGYTAAVAHGSTVFNSPWLFIPALLMIVFLINSELLLLSLKVQNWTLKENLPRIVLILGACSLVLLFGVEGLMWFIILYILVSVGESRRAGSRRSAG